jgi:hypothetical protein
VHLVGFLFIVVIADARNHDPEILKTCLDDWRSWNRGGGRVLQQSRKNIELVDKINILSENLILCSQHEEIQ